MNTTAERLLRLHRSRKGRAYRFSSDTFAGIETRTVPREYYWDGRVRGDASKPDILFQYTLRGWGNYVEGGATIRLIPGMAFLAVLPSAHLYYLPVESPEWTFFWITIRHPYVAARLAQMRKRAPAVSTIDDSHVLLAAAVKVFEGVGLGSFRDDFAREAALFEFLVEYVGSPGTELEFAL